MAYKRLHQFELGPHQIEIAEYRRPYYKKWYDMSGHDRTAVVEFAGQRIVTAVLDGAGNNGASETAFQELKRRAHRPDFELHTAMKGMDNAVLNRYAGRKKQDRLTTALVLALDLDETDELWAGHAHAGDGGAYYLDCRLCNYQKPQSTAAKLKIIETETTKIKRGKIDTSSFIGRKNRKPEIINRYKVAAGSIIMLTTDGLIDNPEGGLCLKPNRIENILSDANSAKEAADTMLQLVPPYDDLGLIVASIN